MSLLPSKPETSAGDDAEPRVVGVESEDADDLLAALSSGTARRLLAELHEEPAPPAKLADRVDTSLQNAQYHLENLEEAGAVTVADTAYSEKGREMDVYAPADQPLVIFAGDTDTSSTIRSALSRLLGGVGVLGLASLAVQQRFGEGVGQLLPGTGGADSTGDSEGAGGAAGGEGTATPAPETGDAAAAHTPTPTPEAEAFTSKTATSGDGGIGIMEATPTPTPTDGGGIGIMEATPTGTPTATPAATPAATATSNATTTELATETARTAAGSGGVESTAGLPPGALFFLGGATMLVVGIAFWYLGE